MVTMLANINGLRDSLPYRLKLLKIFPEKRQANNSVNIITDKNLNFKKADRIIDVMKPIANPFIMSLLFR